MGVVASQMSTNSQYSSGHGSVSISIVASVSVHPYHGTVLHCLASSSTEVLL